MRLGIFGGSFDPPHIGHFLAAVDAAEQLSLDRVLWIPAARQPLKTATPHVATPEQRYAMVSAAVRGHSAFAASRIEIERDGLSFTVTTLEALEREQPAAERFLLVGEDTWARFGDWHQPERVRALARIVVLTRASGLPHEERRHTEDGTVIHLETRRIEVSSTEIRARVAAGKPVRGFVQDAVADIIESEGLYRW